MGLLDKALKYEKAPTPAPQAEEQPARVSGLLERAKKFKEFVTGSPTRPATGGGISGLFKRAAALRDRGLLKKAQAHRSQQEDQIIADIHDPVTETAHAASPLVHDPIHIVEAPPAKRDPAKIEPEAPAKERGGLLARAQKLSGESAGTDSMADDAPDSTETFTADTHATSLDDDMDLSLDDSDFAMSSHSPDEDEGLTDSPLTHLTDSAVADADLADISPWDDLNADATSEFDLPQAHDSAPGVDHDLETQDSLVPHEPELEFVEPDISAELDAAAVDESGERSVDFTEMEDAVSEPEDPFIEYEREAEDEASRLAEKSTATPESESQAKTFLFDADDEFTTAPVEAHIAGQKKIDHYLSLFDIAREITAINDFDGLWDSILFSIVGQLGASTVCIFATKSTMEAGQVFYPVGASGFEMDEDWKISPGSTIYEACVKEDGILYAERFRSPASALTLTDMERAIINNSSSQILVPLKNNGKTYGIVFLGGTHSGEDYAIDDLEFVTLLGGITASGVDRILARVEYDRDTEDLKKRDYYHNRILEAARETSSAKTLDELYDVLSRQLTEHFSVESYSLVLLNPATQGYRIFAGNRISPASMDKFRLGTDSQLVGLVSNFTRVFELPDFRTNTEIASCYTNDDLGIMKHYWVLPLIYQNWLVGFITIHSTRKEWTEFDREMAVSLAEILGAPFGGAIMLEERESLFRDPFSPLEDRLRIELKKAFEFHSHLSLADIRVKNIKRILTLNPSANVTQFLATVGRTVAGFLFHTDFLARIGQGRFALILPGRGKAETEILIKKIRAEFKGLRLLPGSPVDAQFVHTIITTEDTEDAEKMLAILE